MLKTHVEFQSDRFPVVPGEDEETNPEIYGLRLGEFLAEQLNARGYSAECIAEDWGRCVLLANPQFGSFVGCSSYGEGADGWLVFIEPDKPVVRKLFRKIDAKPWIEKLAATLEDILVNHGGAQNLRWWTDEESGRK